VKLSVSLPEDDVAILDEFARTAGLSSRSAALHHAIRLLRHPELEEDYAAAWDEWQETGDSEAWESSVGDGLADAPR